MGCRSSSWAWSSPWSRSSSGSGSAPRATARTARPPASSPPPTPARTTGRCTTCSTAPRRPRRAAPRSSPPTARRRRPRRSAGRGPGKVRGPKHGVVTVPFDVSTRVFGSLREPLALPIENGRVRWSRAAPLPRPARRRGARAPHRAAAARGAPVPQRPGARPRPGPALPDPRRREQHRRPARHAGGSRAPGALRARLPAQRARRDHGARARLRARPRRHPRRRAPRRDPGARQLAGPPGPRRAHVDRRRDRALGRDRAGRPARRGGGDRSAHRRDPRPGRDRLLRPAAPGLDVQDHHRVGRAALRRGDAEPEVPGADRRHARGPSPGERQRRVVRRLVPRLLRPLVQLGLRSASGSRSAPSTSSGPRRRSASTTRSGSPGAETSTLPSAADIGDDLAVGSSAIGQGKVQATALQMALVGSTIASGGRRPKLTLRARIPRPRSSAPCR